MKRVFRKSRGSRVWHFMEACPGWPAAEFAESWTGVQDAATWRCCRQCVFLSTSPLRVEAVGVGRGLAGPDPQVGPLG